jgi:hypothetical protein
MPKDSHSGGGPPVGLSLDDLMAAHQERPAALGTLPIDKGWLPPADAGPTGALGAGPLPAGSGTPAGGPAPTTASCCLGDTLNETPWAILLEQALQPLLGRFEAAVEPIQRPGGALIGRRLVLTSHAKARGDALARRASKPTSGA